MTREDGVQRKRRDMRLRGVRVRPLPTYMFLEFRRFCRELQAHAQSHYGTWRQALHYSDDSVVHAHAIYWRSVMRYLHHLEYLGTHGDES
jgi:hypothetical protein